VLLGSVTTQSICGDLKLTSGIAKGDEGKTPEQDTNSLGGKLLQSTDIDCLRVIPQPVTEVDALDVELAELVVSSRTDDELSEDALDITVSVVDVVDLCS
jgi:hypothetical protein